jgi:hypothetical protein
LPAGNSTVNNPRYRLKFQATGFGRRRSGQADCRLSDIRRSAYIPGAEALCLRGFSPRSAFRFLSRRAGGPLQHDPEKWIPVFGKDHAQTSSVES